MKFKVGDMYDGKWEDGLFHGHGTFIYAKLFEDDDEYDDEGEVKASALNVTPMFVGEYRYGKRVEGTLTYENGDVYTGTFDEDGLRVSGQLKYVSGDDFAGLFEKGAIKCGIMQFKSGDVYSGEFEEGSFHGGGKMLYANGDEYAGEFANGTKHGSG